jgi:hypothetical protein
MIKERMIMFDRILVSVDRSPLAECLTARDLSGVLSRLAVNVLAGSFPARYARPAARLPCSAFSGSSWASSPDFGKTLQAGKTIDARGQEAYNTSGYLFHCGLTGRISERHARCPRKENSRRVAAIASSRRHCRHTAISQPNRPLNGKAAQPGPELSRGRMGRRSYV